MKALALAASFAALVAIGAFYYAVKLSHTADELPILVDIGAIVGLIAICCFSTLIWLWIRTLFLRSRAGRKLTELSQERYR